MGGDCRKLTSGRFMPQPNFPGTGELTGLSLRATAALPCGQVTGLGPDRAAKSSSMQAVPPNLESKKAETFE